VALARDRQVLAERAVPGEKNYSCVLLPVVVELLRAADVRIQDIDGYAICVGPGSFTGLRVGISTVQGLALAAERPCIGASALDVHASRVRGEAHTLVAVMEAYRGEVYAGLYDSGGRPREAPSVGALDVLLRRTPPGSAFAGDGATRYRDDIARACPGARFPERSTLLAGALAGLAAASFTAGAVTAAADLRPLYLREAAVRQGQ
jgi:tRNA threonylcarbamoyladenosine biosynthesis protein TsaB